MAQLELKDGPATEHAPDPVRVFLLSDDPLLRKLLPCAFRRRSDVLLVGAHSWSDASVEIAGSSCDVVLLDDSICSFDTFLLLGVLTQMNELDLVTVCMNDGIAGLISSIHAGYAKGQKGAEPAQRAL